jgi:ABC-type bacteriocin/lantibiotic exporters, contain an N-terminal double-glycine peptidase domain
MKLYPFVYTKDQKESAICCFISFVKYHGYQIEKDYVKLIFNIQAHGISYQSLLNGLDAFKVIYERVTLKHLHKKISEGLLINVEGCCYLCCGKILDYIVLMDTQKGYTFLSSKTFSQLAISYAIQLKFLGEYPYPQTEKKQYFIYALDILISGLCIGVVYYLPIKHEGLVLLGLIFQCLLYYKIGTYLQAKKMQSFANTLISSSALKQFQQQYHLNLMRHLLISCMLSMQILLRLYFPFYHSYLFLFYLSIPLFKLSVKREKSFKKEVFLMIFGLSIQLSLLLFYDLYFYFYQVRLSNIGLGFILVNGLLTILYDYVKQTRTMKLLDIDEYKQWGWFRNQEIESIESIGIENWRFTESTLLFGKYASLHHFYQKLQSCFLFVNDRPLMEIGQIAYIQHLKFLDSFILDNNLATVEQLFSEHLGFLLEALTYLGQFEKILLLEKCYETLDRATKELLGFIWWLCQDSCFYVVKEAFTYQSDEISDLCLELLKQKAPKIRMLLLVSETKMMNRQTNCAIIRYEKVGER